MNVLRQKALWLLLVVLLFAGFIQPQPATAGLIPMITITEAISPGYNSAMAAVHGTASFSEEDASEVQIHLIDNKTAEWVRDIPIDAIEWEGYAWEVVVDLTGVPEGDYTVRGSIVYDSIRFIDDYNEGSDSCFGSPCPSCTAGICIPPSLWP